MKRISDISLIRFISVRDIDGSTKINTVHKLGFFYIFLTVAENVCFLLVCNFLRYQKPYFDIQYSVTKSRVTMGQGGSGLKFHVNF